MILFVPCCEKGRGGGHLSRCITLTNELRAMGRDTLLYLHEQNDNILKLLKAKDFNSAWLITDINALPKIDFIILDRFQTPRGEFLNWKKIAPVIGIDEGGSLRNDFDFLIDMLIPEGFIKPAANIYSPKLLTKDILQKRKDIEPSVQESANGKKVLITFGQEDSAGLGLKIAHDLSLIKNEQKLDITLLKGALADNMEAPDNVNVMENIADLSEHLHEYDAVITHYGLTAYEAVFSGCEVFLAHPSPHHKKLSKAAGFTTFTQKNFITELHRGRERNQSKNSVKLQAALAAVLCDSNLKNETLAQLINNFSLVASRSCPVCGSENTHPIARFSDRTYRRCTRGGLIFMDRLTSPPVEYEKEYFFESYKKQYGKTYLEDFDNIKQAGKQRIKRIKNLFNRSALKLTQEKNTAVTLLDIGCAYGPFLDAARDEGFSVFGIDPVKDAVDYVKQKLGIEAEQSLFPFSYSKLSDSQHFTVVTLWYVIEHFTECKIILNEIKRIIKSDGILAFSTPSFSGISGISNLKKFLYASPADHFTVWSPKIVKKILFHAGFKVKKIIITGHHPERFPILGKLAKNKKSFFYFILLAISKLLGLGDTFEVYAKAV